MVLRPSALRLRLEEGRDRVGVFEPHISARSARPIVPNLRHYRHAVAIIPTRLARQARCDSQRGRIGAGFRAFTRGCAGHAASQQDYQQDHPGSAKIGFNACPGGESGGDVPITPHCHTEWRHGACVDRSAAADPPVSGLSSKDHLHPTTQRRLSVGLRYIPIGRSFYRKLG
jgi:hypothetical protein